LIFNALKQRVLLLDGAFGTVLQQYKFTEQDYRGNLEPEIKHLQKGNNDLLVLSQPNTILETHFAYLNAGADILTTNTFNSNAISMADYGLQHHIKQLNQAAVKLAKQAITQFQSQQSEVTPKWVAGCVGPTNKTASISPSVDQPELRNITFAELKHCYREQIDSLMMSGVDLILIETVFDTLNAKAALFAATEAMSALQKTVPIMVSGTITDNSGRTLSGQTVEAFVNSVSHIPLLAIGLNCALGASQLLPYIKQLANCTQYAVSCHPNAGLPNTFGEYDQTPTEMAALIQPFLQQKLVNIIGGCCGTTPEHIQALKQLLANNHQVREL